MRTFSIYTDSETGSAGAYNSYVGRVRSHPFEALQLYRRQRNDLARMVVVGMQGAPFTIADPRDAGSLDVVGYDTATPHLIAAFANGEL